MEITSAGRTHGTLKLNKTVPDLILCLKITSPRGRGTKLKEAVWLQNSETGLEITSPTRGRGTILQLKLLLMRLTICLEITSPTRGRGTRSSLQEDLLMFMSRNYLPNTRSGNVIENPFSWLSIEESRNYLPNTRSGNI